MLGNFDRCNAFTLAQEGGFCNVKGDPGGATNHGITMGELSAVLGRPATVADVMAVTSAQAAAIYKPRYWDEVSGDGLVCGVDLVVHDFGVMAGPKASAERLQALLGLKVIDGDVGPVTLAAVRAHDPGWLIAMLTYSHIAYYRALPTFAEFGTGWTARAQRARAAAVAMLPTAVRP